MDSDAPFFREFALRLPSGVEAREIVSLMQQEGFLAGVPLEQVPGGGSGLLVAVTEKRLWKEIDAYAVSFGKVVENFVVETKAG